MNKLKYISICLALIIAHGCNNVDNMLKNYSNILSKDNIEKKTDIQKEPTLDVCDLFFTDSIIYKWRNEEIKILHIEITPDISHCNGVVIDGAYFYERSFEFIEELKEEAIFLIQSSGSISDDNSILGIIEREYDNFGIEKNKRKICLMRDERLLQWKENYEKAPPPPPPRPPQIIEIVEDEVEIEDELEIKDTESDEYEIIELEAESNDEFFMVVENMPEFPGGDLGLMKYIQKNVKYPPIAKEYNITGKVYVSFIVDKSGAVTNVKVVRGVDKNLDAEAVRVVKSLPKYKPGKQRGKPVRVMFTIPINFTLN